MQNNAEDEQQIIRKHFVNIKGKTIKLGKKYSTIYHETKVIFSYRAQFIEVRQMGPIEPSLHQLLLLVPPLVSHLIG